MKDEWEDEKKIAIRIKRWKKLNKNVKKTGINIKKGKGII
jgi:hypothetical protein